MKFIFKENIDRFFNNSKDYPFLAGFIAGFYPLVFFYSNNFDSVNSLEHLFFYLFYYIFISIAGVFILYKVFQKSRFPHLASQSIIVMTLLLVFVYLFGFVAVFRSYKKIGLLLFLTIIVLTFRIKNHKYLTFFLFVMSIIPVYKLVKIAVLNVVNSTEWQQQPDNILSCQFKKKPNIYYIQPDGYTSEVNLRGSLYRYDNSAFDNWLKEKKFTLYNDYRSNYESTLFSNSSCFFMKHHFSNAFSNFKYARDYIVGENPVLKILKNNGYKTFFITERPYLLKNRPKVFYDYANFKVEDIPVYEKDGWEIYKSIDQDIEKQVAANVGSTNFFFIELFKPGHISVYEKGSLGVETERAEYIKKIKKANEWLKKTISFIEKDDPNSIVIIGADHGGFVGFNYTVEAQDRITDSNLVYSIFGAKLAIRWNDQRHVEYDANLKTPVNLFRVIFSYLSEDRGLLKQLQPDISFNRDDPADPSKVYKAIDENGSSAFLNKKNN